MMKIAILYLGLIILVIASGNKATGQIINGAFKRTDVYQRKPLPLPMVRESDVFWSKKLWRIIDLREKINQPLYYPLTETDARLNLISLLLKGIESGQITAYDARLDDDFKNPMTFAQVKEAMGANEQTKEVTNFETGEKEKRKVMGEVRTQEIKQYMLKEEWYFDKQNSTLNVRIIGIAPIREFIREGDVTNQVQRQQVFWVYYPETRNLLAANEAFNPYNDARNMSFDDIFIKRFFNSYIVKESNSFNRYIRDFLSGKEAMLESKRVEDNIFDFEQNLWEY
jgi:gliding motility associated protien GldN